MIRNLLIQLTLCCLGVVPLWAAEETQPSAPPAVRDSTPIAHELATSAASADTSATPSASASPDRPADAPSKDTLAKGFSNACQPPALRGLTVPKDKQTLQAQVGENFRIARRGSFLIAGDLDPQTFTQLVDGVFACCKSCLKNDYFPMRPPDTVTIYVFRDSASYRTGLRDHFGMAPISPYGHYSNRQRYIVVNYETGPGTLVHELTHALMATDFPNAPIWISEGIASLYEQCRVEGNSLKGEPNWRLPELQKSLSEKSLTPLRTLLSYDFREFRAENESLHYAESRYFCKYAEEQGLLRQIYATFRENHAHDPSGIKTVEKAFGKSLEEIEVEWHAWIRTQEWN